MGYGEEPEEKLKRFIGPSLMDSFERLYGMSEEDATKATKLFRSLYVDNKMYDVTVYPGIQELLGKCLDEGLKTFVVTSKVQAYAERIIEKIGLDGYFTSIVGPDPTDFSSDKSRLINRAVAEYSLQKKECVMIGSSLCLEVVLLVKTAHACNQAFGESAYSHVVFLGSIVEVFACHVDAVFGAFQLRLQFEEVLVCLEVGIVLGDGEQTQLLHFPVRG